MDRGESRNKGKDKKKRRKFYPYKHLGASRSINVSK